MAINYETTETKGRPAQPQVPARHINADELARIIPVMVGLSNGQDTQPLHDTNPAHQRTTIKPLVRDCE